MILSRLSILGSAEGSAAFNERLPKLLGNAIMLLAYREGLHISTLVRIQFKLSAWVAGFAIMIFYEGMGSFYTTYRSSINQPVETLSATVCRDLPKQPWPIILAVIGILASYIILNKTTFGINFRAVGSNAQVAGYMGIKSKKTMC